MIQKNIAGGVCAPEGFVAGGIHCGVKAGSSPDKKDLAMIYSRTPCAAAAVYTRNKVFGAPITVTRENIADGTARAVICNSGNANTCNADGVEKAQTMCALAAQALGIEANEVVVASTGVIGQPLNIVPIQKGVQALAPVLSREGGHDAALAIMTTDTKVKEMAVCAQIGGKTVTLGAIAKGSGMIHPNMATMLSFITTDCAISASMLKKALTAAVDDTYNMVSVDGDTSTNDMVAILANGLAGNAPIGAEGEDFNVFCEALHTMAADMARAIAGDGEGATKLLECRVSAAPDLAVARKVAKSVIMSPLVKTAMFGADANWGRILCAIGYSDAQFDIGRIAVDLSSDADSVHVCERGVGVPFSEEEAKRVLLCDHIFIDIDMGQGTAAATAYGCDLTYDYVKINGDYRT